MQKINYYLKYLCQHFIIISTFYTYDISVSVQKQQNFYVGRHFLHFQTFHTNRMNIKDICCMCVFFIHRVCIICLYMWLFFIRFPSQISFKNVFLLFIKMQITFLGSSIILFFVKLLILQNCLKTNQLIKIEGNIWEI